MEYAYFATIKQHQIAIFIVPENKQKLSKWAKSLLDARLAIYRILKNCRLPFVGHVNTPGKLYSLRLFQA